MMKGLPPSVRAVIDILEQNGFSGYLVGGCVRDFLMGIEPHDYDLTTDALPEQIKGASVGTRSSKRAFSTAQLP